MYYKEDWDQARTRIGAFINGFAFSEQKYIGELQNAKPDTWVAIYKEEL